MFQVYGVKAAVHSKLVVLLSMICWFKHILLAKTVDIIKQMLTVFKL